MKQFRVNIWEQGEYTYPAAYGFLPNIRTYLHEDAQIRPAMLVVPGGGYCMVCPHEGEIIAKEFYERGMNAFVLTYTTDITMSVPLKRQPMEDLSRALRLIRKNSGEYGIDPERIAICGFSAGGHVCASVCTHFADIIEENPAYAPFSNRPDAAILSYPVITSGKYTHQPSMDALMGYDPSEEEKEYYCLEKQVSEQTPPCFLWQTAEDGLVPVENSYLFAESLKAHGVPFAHYVFPYGGHGLSLASEDFFLGKHGEPYTFEQLNLALEQIRKHTALNVSERRYAELTEQFFGEPAQDTPAEPAAPTDLNPYPDVRMWPELADLWLKKVFGTK